MKEFITTRMLEAIREKKENSSGGEFMYYLRDITPYLSIITALARIDVDIFLEQVKEIANEN
mgnify:FL=1